jgi:membrane protein involved in D-alanine export
MTPYAGFTYFGVALYPSLPAIVQGLFGPRGRRAVLVTAVVGMTIVQYWQPVRLAVDGVRLPVRELWLVAAFAVLQWSLARGMLAARASGRPWPLAVSVGLSLAPLAVAKLSPLLSPGSRLEFLGLSYVTFRSLDVVFGIHDGVIRSLPAVEYLAYLFFFPTVSAGPIDRFRRFERDWGATRSRSAFLEDLDGAVQRIVRGFFYKFVMARLVQQYWMQAAAGGSGFMATLSYMYAYSFYLFFDFAGYSAFAVGFSYLFGVHTPENFDRPLLARNIRDFWNRWHMTLSFWFRDHVYTRFVLAAAKGRWFADIHTASYLGFFLAMGLMGLWHGTAWYYVAYGLYHGALLVAHDVFTRWNKASRVWGDGPLWQAAGIVVTFHAVAFGFLLFSGRLAHA